MSGDATLHPDKRLPTVLLVEDTPSLARVYQEYLRPIPSRLLTAGTGAEALALLQSQLPAVVLLDLNLPDISGLDVLRRIQEWRMPVAAVVITAHGSVNVAVEAMRAGAIDFLAKPFSAERLLTTVRNALERQRLAVMVEDLQETFGRDRFEGFIGTSLAMQGVYRIIDSAAASRATVFVTGESGTGKELAAEAIHRRSPRRSGPFVAINCAAIPRDLIESELFGHVRGAFTGAMSDRDGAAWRADGGTLFLDEIAELDLNLQGKLLRFLQSGRFTPVGSDNEQSVDIRIVCATNRDPMGEVRAGRFREDLYYRLHVVPIAMPPLRERGEDTVLLARHFLNRSAAEEGKRFATIAPEAEGLIAAYDWPGNVRELENVIRNIVVLNNGTVIEAAMLPDVLRSGAGPAGTEAEATPAPAADSATASWRAAGDIQPLWQVEKAAIDRAIALCNGNIPRAAALLEVSPSTLYRKIQRWQEEGRA